MHGSKKYLQNLDILSESVERFWELETFGTHPKADLTLSPKNEQKPIKLLEDTVEKTSDKHYFVGLLWKEHITVLPFNRDLAIMHLKSLENKFKRDPEFYKSYKNTMKDYINTGHASKLLLEELKQTPTHTTYIPYHGVKKVNKPGKVRLVFDVGAKFQSTSLNEKLFKGPELNSLIGVLIRLRKEEFALCGDIEQMFHQMRYNDRNALHFLWREQTFDPIEDFKMHVHLFGKMD